jgi:hypothetical protein
LAKEFSAGHGLLESDIPGASHYSERFKLSPDKFFFFLLAEKEKDQNKTPAIARERRILENVS